MNKKLLCGWTSALCLGATALSGQQPPTIEELQRQLKQATDNFDKALQEHRKIIDELNQRLQAVQQQQAAATNLTTTRPPAEAAMTKPWSPADPIRLGRGNAYADIGLVATFAAGGSTAKDIGALQPGGHDPNQRGFTVQGVEMTVSGAVDPYFRALANLTFAIDSDGESFIEVEEAWAETTSLPGNFQLRGGQVFSEFGRHNPTHLHAWGFVDAPLVNARLLGPDGLRNPGARVAWLLPTPNYTELILGLQNSQGETAASFRSEGGHHGEEGGEEVPLGYRHGDNDRGVRHFTDLLFTPRLAMSLDLTEAQVLLLGASAAFGPNSRGGEGAGDTETQIYGADLTWKWKSPRHSGGFPFVSVTTEALLRRYDLGAFDWDESNPGVADPGEIVDPLTTLPALLPGETVNDYGFYTQVLYGFRKGWVAGVRFDFVTSEQGDYEKRGLTLDGEELGRDPERAQRWRLSPNLTWYPSEFSKVRLQYNYDRRLGLGEDHSVWLQFEFSLGAHAAHKF